MKPKIDIPANKEIIAESFEKIKKEKPEMLESEFIKKDFSKIVKLFFDEAYKIYMKYENKVIEDLTQDTLDSIKKDTLTKDEVKTILGKIVNKSIELEKSLRQSRYARAGSAFEIIVGTLLEQIGIKSEHITREDKKSGLRPIDLVIPDRKTAIERPDDAHFLSLKTSLKDRWKLVVEDQTQGQRTHLITLLQGEKLTDEVAQKIIDRGIFLYIPDEIKDECFKKNTRVRKLSSLPSKVK